MLLKLSPSPNITSPPALIPSQETPQDRYLASPSPGADRGARKWHRPRHRACDYRNCRPSYWCKRLQGRERTVEHRNGSHCPLLLEAVERSSTYSQLTSFQIRQELLLLGNETGTALPFLLLVSPGPPFHQVDPPQLAALHSFPKNRVLIPTQGPSLRTCPSIFILL